MAKPKHKEILTHFLETFLPDQTLTSSQYKMQSVKLSQLKKVVKEYIVTANIDTDKSVEQIIWETIDYAGMTGCKFKSIASLGYDILGKSIKYWIKHEQALKEKEEEAERIAKQAEREAELIRLQNENNAKRQHKKLPKWMLEDDD